MSNSCYIATENNPMGVYLHWNGGLNSVIPFIEYCRLQGFRSPEDDSYGFARLCQVVGNFFGGSNSLGISEVRDYKTDNGTYFIKDWSVVGHPVENYNQEKLIIDLLDIDKRQPQHMQIANYILGKTVKIDTLKIGDIVLMENDKNTFSEYKVVGFSDNYYCKNENNKTIPYIDKHKNNITAEGKIEINPNNYIYTKTVRIPINKVDN